MYYVIRSMAPEYVEMYLTSAREDGFQWTRFRWLAVRFACESLARLALADVSTDFRPIVVGVTY